jgi:hypothetical protein
MLRGGAANGGLCAGRPELDDPRAFIRRHAGSETVGGQFFGTVTALQGRLRGTVGLPDGERAR